MKLWTVAALALALDGSLADVMSTTVVVTKPTVSDETYLRLEGIKQKCLVEELPRHTVLLVKHSASAWNSMTSTKLDSPFQLLVTVTVYGSSRFDFRTRMDTRCCASRTSLMASFS